MQIAMARRVVMPGYMREKRAAIKRLRKRSNREVG
jgi:hypothetical protein